jgi:LCP family protein required for cell wall assembly
MATPPRRPPVPPTGQRPPRRSRRLRPFILALALVLGSGGGGVAGVLAATWSSLKPGSISLTDIPRMAMPLTQKMNLLVLGSDIPYDERGKRLADGSTRSDTLMLVGVDPGRKKISVLSIPRDTRVLIPGQNTYDKINAAYAIGGPELTMKTVNAFTGVPIDGFVSLKVDGLEKLIDLIGGVDIYVENRMYYVDETAHLGINIHKGWHRMNGAQAHQFVRFRHDALGDIGRVQRQQQFIRATLERFMNPSVFARLPQLAATAQEHLNTNLPYSDLVRVANFARGLPKTDVRMVMLPGNFSSGRYLASYWLPNPEAARTVIADLFPDSSLAAQGGGLTDVATRQAAVKVTVLNGSGEAMMASKASRALRVAGWKVWAIAQNPRVLKTTQIVCQTGMTDLAAPLGQAIGVSNAETVPASVGDITTDFTIIVGKDFAQAMKQGKLPSPASAQPHP